jgi:hypothetical protein
MNNKRVLSKAVSELGKAKAPAKPKDIITDPMGQWKFPGQNTRIPGENITMQGVSYPVLAQPNVGQPQIMYPGMEYQFPGADYVDEYPQMKKGGLKKNKTSRNLMATKKLFAKNFLFKKPGKNTIYDPKSPNYQDGGEQDAMDAMMKARLAYANEFGNPAAQRMINIPDNPYDFGNGNTGTHYMASMDNYAVPQIQDENGQLTLGDYGPDSNEAMRFETPEDAEYFAEHYKEVSPGFIEAELTDAEIEEYKKGGYIVEDISVPELTKAQLGKNTSLTMSPYSLNASGIQLASKKFDEYNPELLLGVKQTLKSPGKQYKHNASLDVGLPYEGKFIPSVKANYHGAYTGGNKAASAFSPSVHSDLQAGYTPNQGFNVGMTANPRVEFGNVGQDKYLKQNWPAGAWKGYTGVTGGIGYRGKGFNKDVGAGDIGPEVNKMAGRAHIGYGINAGFETRPFRNTPLRMGVDASVTSSLMKAAGEQQDVESGKFATGNTPMIKANLIYPIVQNTVKKQDRAEQQRKIDDQVFNKEASLEPIDSNPNNSGDIPKVRVKKEKPKPEPTSLVGDLPIGYLPGYNPETGQEVPESFTRKAYGYDQGPTMYKKGGYLPEVQNTESIEAELTDEEIQAYIDAGYYIEELD